MENPGTARQAIGDNIIRRMRFVHRMTKATDTHSECVTLTFILQVWLRERVSILLSTYSILPVLFLLSTTAGK